MLSGSKLPIAKILRKPYNIFDMTVKHFSLGIILLIAGIFLGTGQTLIVQNIPHLFPKPTIIAPIPARDIVPTASPPAIPTPTCYPHYESENVYVSCGLPTPTPHVVRYYYQPTITPKPTL